MAYVKVTKSDTFESWRQKTNEIGANLGDYPLLYKNATVDFTGISGQPPSGYAGATAAVFSITATAGVYSVASITTAGLGYSVGDIITVYGSDLGGLNTTNDLTLTVATGNGSTGIGSVTVSGTAASNLQAESNLLRDEVGSATLDLTTTASDIKAAVNELDLKQGSATLTTTASDLSGAVNELDLKQGTVALTTSASDISAAINELDSKQGSTALSTSASNLSGAINELDTKQGSATLTTTSSNVSGAINELDGRQGNVTLTTSASDLSAAVNELDLKQGSVALSTSASNLSGAINELDTKQGAASLTTSATTISGAINELDSKQGSATLTTTASNVSGAINELDSKQGSVALSTTASDLSGAVNELDTKQGSATLTTTASNVSSAINELDSKQGSATLSTTSSNVSGAINELDTKQGSATLTTTAANLSSAINELDAEIGVITPGAMNVTATNISGALNEISTNVKDAQVEIGGNMLTDYDGNTTGGGGGTAKIIDALNSLYTSTSLATLDGEYLKRDGTSPIDANQYFTLSNKGVTATAGTELILNTTTGATRTARLRISDVNGNIGINKAPTAGNRLDVSGIVKATSFNENGTTLSTKYAAKSSNNTLAGNNTFSGDVTLSTGSTVMIGGTTVSTAAVPFNEWVQDTIATMFDSSGDLTKTYNDATGKLSFAVDNNSHTHTASNITDWAEAVTDTVGTMVTGNTESGLNVVFDDPTGKLNFSITGGTAITTDSNGVSVTSNGIGATQLNVSGNGSTSQFLRSDADGSFTWAVPTDTHTTYSHTIPSSTTKLRLTGAGTSPSTSDIEIAGGTNVTVTRTSASKLTIASSWRALGTTSTTAAAGNHIHLASAITNFDAEVANNSAVAANTAKVSDINHNVTTHLGYTSHASSGIVTSSDGNDATLPAATTVIAGLMTTTDKSKLNGIASSANNYSHPITNGNKHIPSGGSAGEYLTWGSAGTAVWSADTFDADVADKITAMVTSVNTENGISVSVDGNDKLSFDVNDPTITLSGDVTGSVVMNNLGSVNMVTTVVNASHTHPFSQITGTIATAQYGTSTITATALAANCVGSSEIATNAVGSSEIAANAVGSSEIAANAVGNSELGTNAVQQVNISDDAVGSGELKSLVTLLIKNSAGTTVKTLYGAGA